MPLCWIFLLKRRSAASNDSFSPTLTSANLEDHLPSVAVGLSIAIGTGTDDLARAPGAPTWRLARLAAGPAREAARSLVEPAMGGQTAVLVRPGRRGAPPASRVPHAARSCDVLPPRTKRP